MHTTRRSFLMASAAAMALPSMKAFAADNAVTVDTPMDPPEWALLERELLHAHTAACVKFFHRYFNQATGWLETTVRYGGDDGPDDAIENVNDWPHVYALGGDEVAVYATLHIESHDGHKFDVPVLNVYRMSPNGKLASLRSFWEGG